VKKADVVVVIQDGKVVSTGDHDTAATASQTHKALAGRK
jgi:ABC-type transport system involved in cytochrome bd biosynthesis fused ATPase/permease subunit